MRFQESVKKDKSIRYKFLYLYIILFFLLSLTSPLAVIVLIGFGLYAILSLVEEKKIYPEEFELALFSLFLYLWVQFIFFKRSLLEEGISFIWQNIPLRIVEQYFPKFSIGSALVLVSIIPFLTGVVVVYKSLFKLKNQKSFFLQNLTYIFLHKDFFPHLHKEIHLHNHQ